MTSLFSIYIILQSASSLTGPHIPFVRIFVIKQSQFANDIILQNISIIDNLSQKTTTACRLQSASESEDCAVFTEKEQNMLSGFSCQHVMSCYVGDSKAQVFAVALYKQLT